MKKALLTILVLAALGYGGYFYWKKSKSAGQAAHAAAVLARPTSAKVEVRDIRLTISAAGEIGPADQVSVRPEVNGKISILTVDIGDQVKKGELLFALDDSDLQIERSSRQSDIDGAKLQLAKAQRNYDRSQQLFTDHLVSHEVYDDVKTDFDMSKNALDRAEKDLRLVDDHISKTKIAAPFDCTVLTRPVSVGQAVSGSGGFNSGTEVLTIANLNDMIIIAHVNQADVTHLHMHQPVDIQVESVAGLKMQGKVERIAPQATIKNNLKGFDARIVITKIDPRARPGMTANLSIPVVSAHNALAVPISAVYTEPNATTKEMERFVYVKKSEESFERRLVQSGVADTDYVEITDGLAVNEEVNLEEPPEGAEITVSGQTLKKKKADKTASASGSLVPK